MEIMDLQSLSGWFSQMGVIGQMMDLAWKMIKKLCCMQNLIKQDALLRYLKVIK